jgi:hypothetical protein
MRQEQNNISSVRSRWRARSHTVIQAFALNQKRRIVACRTSSVAAEGQFGIEGKSSLDLGPSFIQTTQVRQGSGEVQMRKRKISIAFDGPVEHDGLLVSTESQFGTSRELRPSEGPRIERREAQRSKDMAFGFLGATDICLGQPDL